MIHATFAAVTSLASAMGFTGFALGLVYFVALRRTAALLAAGGSWLGPAALTIGRLGGATILLVFTATLGAVPLLATFVGFLVARAVVLHTVRRDK